MAGKQLEAIGHLFHQAQIADKGAIDLKKGEFDPFDIEYALHENFHISRLALVGTGRAIIPDVGSISWGVFAEGEHTEGLKRKGCEDLRRRCNVGLLVARNKFTLLEVRQPEGEAEVNTNTLLVTRFAEPATFDPTVSQRRPDFAQAT